MMSLETRQRVWQARLDPRRQTPSVGIYAHVRDRWGIFYAQPIVLNERQVGAAIEGVLRQQDIEVAQLAVDTHGYTDFGMAFAHGPGLDLCPRLKALKDRHLFLPRGCEVPPILKPICQANLDFSQVPEHWDRWVHSDRLRLQRAHQCHQCTRSLWLCRMRRFVLGWKILGCERRFNVRIVNYADDFVICCKGRADEAMTAMRKIMGRLKLTVNEEKTRICDLPEGRFDFFGYNFGRCYSTKTGRPYLGTRPSKKSIKHIVGAVHMQTERSMAFLDAVEVVQRLNWMLGGWANYFYLGPVTKAYRSIDAYTKQRLRRWLCGKHKEPGTGLTRFPDEYLYQTLGLICLPLLPPRLPWANA